MNENFWVDLPLWQQLAEEQTTAHRIYSGTSFKIDRYGNDLLISRYGDIHLDPQLEELKNWCDELHFQPRRIFLKDLIKNPTANSLPQLIKGDIPPGENLEETVLERGIPFLVDLRGGYSTGLFIDQRINREKLVSFHPRQVLNCFAYTCAFSVVAAVAGASTTSIDLAPKALERGKHNFKLSNIPPEGHYFIADDVRGVLPRLHKKGLRFDAIIMDPPTFARSKKGPPFQVEKEFPRLIEVSLDCAAPSAHILLSTNCRDIGVKALRAMARKALELRGWEAEFEEGETPVEISVEDSPSTLWVHLK